MSGRLSLIGQNQPMLNPSNFGGPFELGTRGNLPPPAPLSAALVPRCVFVVLIGKKIEEN